MRGAIERSRLSCSWVSGCSASEVPIYLTSGYQSMVACYDRSKARVLCCESRGSISYMPMLVRHLGDGRHEAYSAYGYGGVLGNLTFSPAEVDELRRFLADEGIVALFLRHSPFLANQEQWPSSLTELNRRTYAAVLSAEGDFDERMAKLPQKLRWSVNHARRQGLQPSFTPLSESVAERKLIAFYELYAELMRSKKTSAYYLFSLEFFLAHARQLGAACELAEIHHPQTGDLIAGALFMHEKTGWVHYHLSAARPEAMKLQGMELLMAYAMQRYGSMGYRALHLGGGHSLDETDGLSRFKAKFADQKLDFYCTKLICDPAAYQAERARFQLQHPNFFLISDARMDDSKNADALQLLGDSENYQQHP